LRKDWKASQAREAVKVPLAGAAQAEGKAQQASERSVERRTVRRARRMGIQRG
jgi:hypothetical protein